MKLPPWAAHAPQQARDWLETQDKWSQNTLGPKLPPLLTIATADPWVWFPVVLQQPHVRGLLLRAAVAGRQDHESAAWTPLSEQTHANVRAWLAALVGCAAADLPPVALVCDGADDQLKVEGRSVELAAAVAWLSAALGRPSAGPPILSATAGNDADPAGLGCVDKVAEKAAVCELEAPGTPRLILASDLGARALGPDEGAHAKLAEWFGSTWLSDLAAALDRSPNVTTERAWVLFQGRRFDEAALLSRVALGQGASGREAVLCWWMIGVSLLHRGVSDAARAALADASARHANLDPERDACERWEFEVLLASRAVAITDIGTPSLAIELLESALKRLDGSESKDRGWRYATLQVLGSLHRAHLAAGDLASAFAALERSLGAPPLSHERCRVLMDLAEVYRRAGDPVSQHRSLVDARAAFRMVRDDDRDKTRRFLELYEWRAGLRSPPRRDEPADWRDWPQPAEIAESLLAHDPGRLMEWLTENWPAGHQVTALVFAGFAARTLAAGRALPDALVDKVRALAAHEPFEPPVREALDELAAGRPELWVQRCPY